MTSADWMCVLGVVANQATQLLPFILRHASHAIADLKGFEAAVGSQWEIQWKSHLARDLLAPWLQPCTSSDIKRLIAKTNFTEQQQILDLEKTYWMYDSSYWDSVGADNLTVVLHGTTHEIICLFCSTCKPVLTTMTACLGAGVTEHRAALDQVLAKVMHTHQTQFRRLIDRVSLVMKQSVQQTISSSHPMRIVFEQLTLRLCQTANNFKQSVNDVETVSEIDWDVRQRIGRSLGINDIKIKTTAATPGYRTIRTHIKTCPLSDRVLKHDALDQLTQHNLQEQLLLPFLERVSIEQRIRQDAVTIALDNPNASHANYQLRIARREIIEDALIMSIGELKLNTYESIQLQNWSRVFCENLRVETLIQLDPKNACPYKTINLLSDLLVLLSECQNQLAQYQPTLWQHSVDDNILGAIKRISRWVDSRKSRSGTPTSVQPWLDTLASYVEQQTVRAAAISRHSIAQPENSARSTFRI